MDHIDISYRKNVPSYGVDAIPEHTFALLLASTRNIIPSIEQPKVATFISVIFKDGNLLGKQLKL